ncbi:MAG TPA: GNAT family N-acetyltransferase [Gemmatimonadaceae bacterium]|nr:GNAT family N-acetyltransferase [Gemmatimonadaceae bacterium]
MIERPSPSPASARHARASRREASDGITVRPAHMADLPLIVELRLALLREHGDNPIYERLRPDAPDRARRLFAAQLRSPDEVIFLGEVDGEVSGILRCIQTGGLPLLFPATHGYISSVYVVPRARRRGVLRALLAAAIQWCESRGLTELRLHNASDNAVANAAWDALGFRIVEHLRVRRLA